MRLSDTETNLIFSIMRDLSGEFDHDEVRRRVGQKLLELLQADYFASYVWDETVQQFVSCVQINMSDDNLRRYESHFQFHDPITPTLQTRRKATPVSEVMRHDKLIKTEFFNDFLKQNGPCYGMNFFAYDRGDNIGGCGFGAEPIVRISHRVMRRLWMRLVQVLLMLLFAPRVGWANPLP